MMRKLRVYVAGPYTKPDPCVNTFNAVQVGQKLLEAGHYPFVPHLTHFWHTMVPNPYEKWLELDMEWLKVSDCVLRLPGESSGADAEVAEAEALDIPVFHNINQVLAFSVNSYKPNNTTVILKKRVAELESELKYLRSFGIPVMPNINDEAAGCFIRISQNDDGTVKSVGIDTREWPLIRAAIDELVLVAEEQNKMEDDTDE